VFSGLVTFDDNLNLVPDLAESWTVSRDGLEYRFTLRENARFHHGRAVTAVDVLYSFTRLFDPGRISPGIIQDYLGLVEGAPAFAAGTAKNISGFSAPSPRTFVIRLTRPYPSFLAVLAMDQARVVPGDVLEEMGPEEFGRHPVGSGPFRFSRWDPERELVLVRNPDYFGHPALLDTVVVRHFPNGKGGRAEREAFARGEIDALEVNQREADAYLRQGGTHLVRRLELSMEFLGLRSNRPPFDDMRLRRALALAVDRTALKRAAGMGFETPTGVLPPGMPGYSPQPRILPYDPDRARDLLAEAGYGPGHPLAFDLYTSNRTPHAVIRDSVLVASLRRVGVEAHIRNTGWLELNQAINSGTAPAFQITWIADLPDPDSFLFTLLSSEGTYNIVGYHNDRVDSLLALARVEPDLARRMAAYREAEEFILEDAPLLPLFNVMLMYVFRSDVKGVEMSPFGICSVPMEKIWLDSSDAEGGDLHAGL
jgi:peptide/nickel transport system substrate-binding protein/oligopeptide transport system substrate-binding protein